MRTGQRTFVTYDADFPDDSEWDENENLTVPGGRAIAGWFRQQFLEEGLDCSELVQHSFYGWRFDVRVGKCVVQCILQGGHPWLMISQPRTSLLHQLIHHNDYEPLHAFVLALHAMLIRDARFSSVRWFTRVEYEGGDHAFGAEVP
jgi:hypothetical protein